MLEDKMQFNNSLIIVSSKRSWSYIFKQASGCSKFSIKTLNTIIIAFKVKNKTTKKMLTSGHRT